MSATRSFPCPNCGCDLQIDARLVQGVLECASCGSHVSISPRDTSLEYEGEKDYPAESVQAGQAISPNPASWRREPIADAEPGFPDIKLKTGGPTEALAVAALLVPLVALCVLFLGTVDSVSGRVLLSWGAVFVSVLLLTIDAYCLGTIDQHGQQRASVGTLFVGMVLLWLVFYPLAFFRRRHFGRTNLGPLALLVVVIFVASPFAGKILDRPKLGVAPFGKPALEDEPPACDGADLKFLLEDMIKKGPLGPNVRSIGGYREVKHDRAAKLRRGRCVVQTDQHRITVTFEVSWIDVDRREFQVRTLDVQDDLRGYLGINLGKLPEPQPRDVNAGEVGVVVNDVVLGFAAADAGIQPGDIIVRVNKQSFRRPDPVQHLQQIVVDLEPGTEITVEVLRDGDRRQVQVTVGTRPQHLP
ncbi:MAG: PDZ domain-containing protein [Gemmataceae bacterium]|nr:PDZ domain-containing protein [Gemmataceae bacterium]